MRSRFLLLLLPVLFVFSCTIEKRVHRPGYHIEWKKRLHATKGQETDLRPENAVAAIRVAADDATDSAAAVVVSEPNHEVRIFQEEQQTVSDKPLNIQMPSGTHEQLSKSVQIRQTEQSARAKPKAIVVILAAAWFIVAALLVIAGISLLAGSPFWGILLLVIAAIMLFLPLFGGIGGGGKKKKKSSAGFASAFAPKPKSRFQRRMSFRPDKDVQRKAVIVFVLILLYVALAVLGVILGISMISSGTMAVGILLLVLGGLMLLIPAAALIFVALSGEKE
jgi:hypothetical protein